MIERIVIENFKSLRQVDLKLGRMNIFIGSNASGKSNFFDALRVLQGIGNGFTIREILDGKPRSATSEVWEGIRGGSAKACFLPEALTDEIAFIHSLTSKSNTHGPVENFLSTGFVLDGFPSVGSWVSYALGSENQGLPAYVAIPAPHGVPQAGSNNWGPGFLPAVLSAVVIFAIEHLIKVKNRASKTTTKSSLQGV